MAWSCATKIHSSLVILWETFMPSGLVWSFFCVQMCNLCSTCIETQGTFARSSYARCVPGDISRMFGSSPNLKKCMQRKVFLPATYFCWSTWLFNCRCFENKIFHYCFPWKQTLWNQQRTILKWSWRVDKLCPHGVPQSKEIKPQTRFFRSTISSNTACNVPSLTRDLRDCLDLRFA